MSEQIEVVAERYERELRRLAEFVQTKHPAGICKHIGLLEAVTAAIELMQCESAADRQRATMATRTQFQYGYFTGGDPRCFTPDVECCTPQELANHEAACKRADEMESRGEVPDWDCPSSWERWGDCVVHVLRSPFGIGVTMSQAEEAAEGNGGEE